MNCKKCGNELKVDTSIILTSYPPQFNTYCPICNEHKFLYCDEYYGQHSPKIETHEIGKWTRDELINLIKEVIDERLGEEKNE